MSKLRNTGLPEGNQPTGREEAQKGLYVPQAERDSCGTGLIANLQNTPSHKLVKDALIMLENMEHRGACGCEPNTGDGAGILIQIPQKFFLCEAERMGFELPTFGEYGVGMLFVPKDKALQKKSIELLKGTIDKRDFELLGIRAVPVNNEGLGASALSAEPDMFQIFVKHKMGLREMDLERKLYVLRKNASRIVHAQLPPEQRDLFYFTSLSYKTLVYKGQLTTWQLGDYFLDLKNEKLESALALVHSRFSTNTVPKWKLAQPFRYIAHNGEINTITGNVNWWKSREQALESEHFDWEEINALKPVTGYQLSDSGYFDNALEFLVMGGRSVPHTMMMMIPEAWEMDERMEDYKRAFYEYHENLVEPWDGPASICFTNGRLVGATLDRNGLRPSRYCLTNDDRLILASEAGALPVDQSTVIKKGRLQPGKMLVADLDEKRIIADEEVKKIICKRFQYRSWLNKYRLTLKDLVEGEVEEKSELTTLQKQQLFGYSREDIKVILKPMVEMKKDPIGSMGADTPLAVLSQKPQHLANYFKQLFAQVTNPPIDPIRERLVMSLAMRMAGCGNMLTMGLEHARFIRLEQPVLNHSEIKKIKGIFHPYYKVGIIDLTFPADYYEGGLEQRLNEICEQAEQLTKEGHNILILSDKKANAENAPIPSLLATGAIHHHLTRKNIRVQTSLVIEAGDVFETHHYATLIGFGATCVYPYVALETIEEMVETNQFDLFKKNGIGKQSPPSPPQGGKSRSLILESQNSDSLMSPLEGGKGVTSIIDKNKKEVLKNYIKAVGKGLLKIMSKNGISTLQSYQGAQIFELIGIQNKVVEKCFTGAISRIEGIGFDDIAHEVLAKLFRVNFSENIEKTTSPSDLDVGGIFQWKRNGEFHLFNPQSIHLLQFSTRKNDYTAYKKYAKIINDQSKQACTLRGLLEFNFNSKKSIPLSEVEPVEKIFKRFATGAMSFGSISHEAHSTLAIAMNRIGAKSNSGEGGEDPARFEKKQNGDWERSAIKQVASGRFGVTNYYLTNADEIQIKMAQGAKPGEGGQLPGHKVDDWIAKVRHSTPGVGLISPPPHHDIYSIEDLAQLIFDLKNANRHARINVKLVSKAGVGVIASGVAKAHADVILISGHDGGTGASPLTSIRHAGLPWELGLSESHQTLVKNKLRDRVTLQADGQMRTGKDLAVAALLGAEEWGIATAALVVEGCIMMRKCHLNTCPVGIATQNPELRKRFNADPQYIINFFTFLAQDLREIMAELGFRSVDEMVGKTEALKISELNAHPKYRNLDLSPLLFKNPDSENIGQYKMVEQDHGLKDIIDWELLNLAKVAIQQKSHKESIFPIKNTNRSVGTLLSNEITKQYGAEGLPDGSIQFRFKGSAGQSFGAFSVNGIHFVLEGEANDYFGKGLSGGRLIVVPDRNVDPIYFEPSKNIIIGNVALFGATSGEVYIRGMAGERFAVRNSGASAVVEGVGDHGCEYMTGGCVVILGETGKNFAAGMSGGEAYIFDPENNFSKSCNMEMVDLDKMEKPDFEKVRKMVRDHFRYTGSEVSLRILNNWKYQKNNFVKVMPKDFKRVLKERKEREDALPEKEMKKPIAEAVMKVI